MAASRARRNPLPVPDDDEDFLAVMEKCLRNSGMTCPAAEGAKKTIHHGSSLSLSERVGGRRVNSRFSSPARDDARS